MSELSEGERSEREDEGVRVWSVKGRGEGRCGGGGSVGRRVGGRREKGKSGVIRRD